MTENLTVTKLRLLQFAQRQGLRKEEFFQKIQIDGANFRGRNAKSELSVDKIEKILRVFPELSADWLLLGEGSMLRDEPFDAVAEQTFVYLQSKDHRIEQLVRENQSLIEENQRLRMSLADNNHHEE